MKSPHEPQLMEFLQRELSVSAEEIGSILECREAPIAQIPIVLWQRGQITLQQLDRVFDWQEEFSLDSIGG
jgi:Protein of unknown function (DUF2949)